MKIKVKFLDGKVLDLETENEIILEVKNEISVIKDIDIDKIKLIFGGKILANNDTFEKHKITENCVLNCVISKNVPSNNQHQQQQPQSQPQPQSQANNDNPLPGISFFQNLPNFNSNNTQQFVDILSENSELRDFVINMSLQRMNLPSNSPLRSFFEMNINNLSQNSDLLNQFVNNTNITPIQELDNEDDDENYDLSNNNLSNDDDYDSDDEEEDGDDEEEQEDNTDYEKLKQDYSEQFKEIKSMGFEDDNKILNMIQQSHGSVSIAINKLLGNE